MSAGSYSLYQDKIMLLSAAVGGADARGTINSGQKLSLLMALNAMVPTLKPEQVLSYKTYF